MLATIELDHESCLATREIHDEWTDRRLPPKVRSDQPDVVKQPLPKHAFCLGRLGAHLTREFSLMVVHHV
jgi:hypothetical protein